MQGVIGTVWYVMLGLALPCLNIFKFNQYICLWGASERKLGENPGIKPKKALKKSRERARHSATKEAGGGSFNGC
jgi:hypothetical protein